MTLKLNWVNTICNIVFSG